MMWVSREWEHNDKWVNGVRFHDDDKANESNERFMYTLACSFLIANWRVFLHYYSCEKWYVHAVSRRLVKRKHNENVAGGSAKVAHN